MKNDVKVDRLTLTVAERQLGWTIEERTRIGFDCVT